MLKKGSELRDYIVNRFPAKAGNIALRFVNGNFQAKGCQTSTFKLWKADSGNGSVLIKTGKLKAETYFTIQFGQATIQNICLMPKADNKCLSANGTVKAPRNRYKKTKLTPENLPKKQRGNEFSYNEN